MREILFRAKGLENGEWVCWNIYGELCRLSGKRTRLAIKNGATTHYYDYIYQVIERIDKNTISQYTGLCDKNGNKIWENDFVELNEDVKKIFDVENGQVRYYSGTFIIGGKNELSGSLFAIADIFGVLRGSTVGNIFDNPELLQ